MRGCLLWQRDGISPPASVLAATEEYQREEDHVQDFVDECLLVTAPLDRVTATEIYDLYTRWHHKNRGQYVPAMQSFGKHLGHKIHKDRKGGTVYYYGVQLNPVAKDAYPEKKSKDDGEYRKGLWGKRSKK